MSINAYICFALFIKLIVNNVKYGGIHYDYGQLTNTFFLILVKLQDAVQKDYVFTDETKKYQYKLLVNRDLLDKDKHKTLVCNQGKGNNRIPGIKTLSCNELKNSKQNNRGLIAVGNLFGLSSNPKAGTNFGFIAKTRQEKLKFEIGFIFNQIRKSQKANYPSSFDVNQLAFIQNTNTQTLSDYGDGQMSFEYNSKAGLLNSKMSEYAYGYYKNFLTTKRLAPSRFYISHEKLAIRACDLLRFLTISFFTTKSEKNNSLTSTFCNNCFLAVACNCESVGYDVSVSINRKKEKGGILTINHCL